MQNQTNLISAAVPSVTQHSSLFLRKCNFYMLLSLHDTHTFSNNSNWLWSFPFRTFSNIYRFFNTPIKCSLYISTYTFTKSLLYASVCLYAILWDNFVYLLKTESCLQGYYIRCVIKYKHISIRYILYLCVITHISIKYIVRLYAIKYKIYFILYNTFSVITS